MSFNVIILILSVILAVLITCVLTRKDKAVAVLSVILIGINTGNGIFVLWDIFKGEVSPWKLFWIFSWAFFIFIGIVRFRAARGIYSSPTDNIPI